MSNQLESYQWSLPFHHSSLHHPSLTNEHVTKWCDSHPPHLWLSAHEWLTALASSIFFCSCMTSLCCDLRCRNSSLRSMAAFSLAATRSSSTLASISRRFWSYTDSKIARCTRWLTKHTILQYCTWYKQYVCTIKRTNDGMKSVLHAR